jgi:hypothetical protein
MMLCCKLTNRSKLFDISAVPGLWTPEVRFRPTRVIIVRPQCAPVRPLNLRVYVVAQTVIFFVNESLAVWPRCIGLSTGHVDRSGWGNALMRSHSVHR